MIVFCIAIVGCLEAINCFKNSDKINQEDIQEDTMDNKHLSEKDIKEIAVSKITNIEISASQAEDIDGDNHEDYIFIFEKSWKIIHKRVQVSASFFQTEHVRL